MPSSREKKRKQLQAWRKKNPERQAEIAHGYYQRNKERLNERIRDRAIERMLGVTREQYDEMLSEQNFMCPICEKKSDEKGMIGSKRMAVDHDHETKHVRGLLCHQCNMALGLLGDDLEITRRAFQWLCAGELKTRFPQLRRAA